MVAHNNVFEPAATVIEVAPLMWVSLKNAELEPGGPRGRSQRNNAKGYFRSANSSS